MPSDGPATRIEEAVDPGTSPRRTTPLKIEELDRLVPNRFRSRAEAVRHALDEWLAGVMKLVGNKYCGTLPAPWHDSQPLVPLAAHAFAWRLLPWEATISSWHSLHFSLPT